MLKSDYYKYTYTPSAIRKMIRAKDFWLYDIDKDNVEEKTKTISDDFSVLNEVKDIKSNYIGSNKVFIPNTLYDSLTIRRTNSIIKDTFRFVQPSREQEIAQLINLIQSEKNNSAYIFRTDIKTFFESIDFKKVISSLESNNYASTTLLNHLKNIQKKVSTDGFIGLPRGLCISSTLSEYAMMEFDKEVWNYPGIIYYSRYVDDIIIIIGSNNSPQNYIENLLDYSLELNLTKTYFEKIGNNTHIDFLGYSIHLNEQEKTKISLKKMNKIKKRVMLSIKWFIKDNDFELLLDRLKFLTGNSKLKIAGRKKELIVGIRYQYHHCHAEMIETQLKTLDTYLKGLILSKKYIVSKQFRNGLLPQQLEKIKRISFTAGYRNKITNAYTRKRISKVKDAWRYE